MFGKLNPFAYPPPLISLSLSYLL